MGRKSDYPLLNGEVSVRFSFDGVHADVQYRPEDCPFWQCVVVILEELPGGVFDAITSLTNIQLSYNRFTELPPGIFSKLLNLKVLVVGASQLKTLLDNVFANNTALTYLSIYGNLVERLDDDVFDGLNSMKTLEMGENQIPALPAGFVANPLPLGRSQESSCI